MNKLKQLLEKWACKHKWKTEHVYNRSNNFAGKKRVFEIILIKICTKCESLKGLRVR